MIIRDNKIQASQGCKIRRKGASGEPYSLAIILEGETAEDFDELTVAQWANVALQEWKAGEYKRRLIVAIRERYDADDVEALHANLQAASTLPMTAEGEAEAEAIAAEYTAYQKYRSACKARVSAELAEITSIPEPESPVMPEVP